MRKDNGKNATTSKEDMQALPRKNRLLYKIWQPLYREIQKSTESEFFLGNPVDLESDGFFFPKKRNMSTSPQDSRINDLFTEGSHHMNLSLVVLNQNLYLEKDPTLKRNFHYLVVDNPS